MNKKRIIGLFAFLIFLIAVAFAAIFVSDLAKKAVFPKKYSEYVSKYANEYSVDENLVYSLIRSESSFRKDAESSVGARGLMQIMPGTLSFINTMLSENYSFEMMFDPEINIRCGIYYFSYLLERYKGNLTNALCAYNAGPTNVDSWLSDERYSKNGIVTDIPFPETAKYVTKVLSSIEKYEELYK